MKVLHVPRRFTRHDWGGTETVILNTIRGMRPLGVDGEIVTTTALAERTDEVVESVQVRRYDYFYPFFGLDDAARRDMDRKGGNLFSFSLLLALVRTLDGDLFHAHTGKRLGGIVRLAARLRGIPYVVSLHGGHLDIPDAERATLAEPRLGTFEWGKLLGLVVGSRRVIDDAAAILCVGRDECRRMARAFPHKRVEYQPNGVAADTFAGGDGHAFRHEFGIGAHERMILTVGRIDPQKNQAAMVTAMPTILAREPRARLVLLGPVTIAAYRDHLADEVTRLGLSDRVTILPGLPAGDRRLYDAFAAADVFVLPSRHEPFGIVVLEAWSAGLPVIAARVGGIPGFAVDGTTALLFEPGDDEAMAASVLAALASPDLARRLGAQGRVEARTNYDWPVVCRRLASLYGDLVEEGRRRLHERSAI